MIIFVALGHVHRSRHSVSQSSDLVPHFDGLYRQNVIKQKGASVENTNKNEYL